jgi:phthalate 4,5-dioxygenase oxygenase subunit
VCELRVAEHSISTSYGAIYQAEPGTECWRIGHFLLPFYTLSAGGLLGIKNVAFVCVPVDDEHTMAWTIGDLAAPTQP